MAEPGCAVRHERLERVEALAAETAKLLHGQRLQLEHLDARVGGLADAHQSTLEAVRALTAAINQRGGTLDRLESRIGQLIDDYAEHKVQDAADRYALPRVVLWLWATSLAALGALVTLALAEWRPLVQFLRALPWR